MFAVPCCACPSLYSPQEETSSWNWLRVGETNTWNVSVSSVWIFPSLWYYERPLLFCWIVFWKPKIVLWIFSFPKSSFLSVYFWLFACLPNREAITGGLTALKMVIPGGDTFMNLGLEMVRMRLRTQHICKASPNHPSLVFPITFYSGKYSLRINWAWQLEPDPIRLLWGVAQNDLLLLETAELCEWALKRGTSTLSRSLFLINSETVQDLTAFSDDSQVWK